MIYTIVGIVITCIISLIGTLYLAKNPVDKNYGTVNRRVKNLSIIYVISSVASIIVFFVYLFS